MIYPETLRAILLHCLGDNLHLGALAQIEEDEGHNLGFENIRRHALKDIFELLNEGLVIVGQEGTDPTNGRPVVSPIPGSPETVVSILESEWGGPEEFWGRHYGGNRIGLTIRGEVEARKVLGGGGSK